MDDTPEPLSDNELFQETQPSSPDPEKSPAVAESTEADVAPVAILKPILKPSGASPVWGSGDTWGDEEMLPPAAAPTQRTFARPTGNDTWGGGATPPWRDRSPAPPRQQQTAETWADDSSVPLFKQPIRTSKVETPLLDRPLQDVGGRGGRGGGGASARGTSARRDQRQPYSFYGYGNERPISGGPRGAEMREEYPREPPRHEAACSEFWGAPAGREVVIPPRRYATQRIDSMDAQYGRAAAEPTPQHRSDRAWSPPPPSASRLSARVAQPRSPSPPPPARPERLAQQRQREPSERERILPVLGGSYSDYAEPPTPQRRREDSLRRQEVAWADTGGYAARQPGTVGRDCRQEYDQGGRMPREDERSMRREPLSIDTRASYGGGEATARKAWQRVSPQPERQVHRVREDCVYGASDVRAIPTTPRTPPKPQPKAARLLAEPVRTPVTLDRLHGWDGRVSDSAYELATAKRSRSPPQGGGYGGGFRDESPPPLRKRLHGGSYGDGGASARGTSARRDQRQPYSFHGYGNERPISGGPRGAEMREEYPREPPRHEAACSEFWGAPAGREVVIPPRRYASQRIDSMDAQYGRAAAVPTPQHRSDRAWSPSPPPPARPERLAQQRQHEPFERERSRTYRDEAPPSAMHRGVNGGGSQMPAPTTQILPGDWSCPSCNVSNFARRTECFRCRTLKGGGGGGYGSVAYRGDAPLSPRERRTGSGTYRGRSPRQARQPQHVEVPSENW